MAMLASVVVLLVLVTVLAEIFPIFARHADIVTGVHGALVAAATITSAWYIAPAHRRAVGVTAYAFGSWAAAQALDQWYFPEGSGRAYQTSDLPLTMTLVGGLLCVVALWGRSWRFQGSDIGRV